MLTISTLRKESESLNFYLQSRVIVTEATDLPSMLQNMSFQLGFWKKWVEGKKCFCGGYNTSVDMVTVIVDVKHKCKMQALVTNQNKGICQSALKFEQPGWGVFAQCNFQSCE